MLVSACSSPDLLSNVIDWPQQPLTLLADAVRRASAMLFPVFDLVAAGARIEARFRPAPVVLAGIALGPLQQLPPPAVRECPQADAGLLAIPLGPFVRPLRIQPPRPLLGRQHHALCDRPDGLLGFYAGVDDRLRSRPSGAGTSDEAVAGLLVHGLPEVVCQLGDLPQEPLGPTAVGSAERIQQALD